jgi:hypothetical protein
VIRWVCTNNPFYVLSAALFLAGLWASFGGQNQDVTSWALTLGLAGYTLLLAVTACLLVRFGNVWDDVRTVLLLVVLMFLATSVTFDELLVFSPERGQAFCLGGLLFAIAVTEAVLRSIRLTLPVWFRAPYYLILALFFLYPLALRPLLATPQGEELLWGLFGFSATAGLVFLTLLPAIRHGPDCVRDNGSPWRWPLYPWALFGLLALAVPARAFLLCWSLHLPEGGQDQLIFGPYFLVPFGLALIVLLLEAGLVSARRAVLHVALLAPIGLVVLALAGHRTGPIYQGFLQTFTAELGADPLYLTLLAVAGLYAYAALRRVSLATEALTAVLLALAVVGPDTLQSGELVGPQPLPLFAAGVLQLALGLKRRSSWRSLLGAAALVGFIVLALPEEASATPVGELIAFHLALIALLLLGAEFDDRLARAIRLVAAALVLGTCLVTTFAPVSSPEGLAPPWALVAYPMVLAAVLAGYGLVLGHRPALVMGALAAVCWLSAVCWWGYASLREVVAGMDQIALSLVLLGVGVLVSLGKAGALSRWWSAWWGEAPLDRLGEGNERGHHPADLA